MIPTNINKKKNSNKKKKKKKKGSPCNLIKPQNTKDQKDNKEKQRYPSFIQFSNIYKHIHS